MHPLKNEDSEKSDEEVARAGFDGGGGGGYDGSMRERITKLEAFAAEALRRFDHIDARFDSVGVQLAALTKTVNELKQELSDHKQEFSEHRASVKQEFSEHRAAVKQEFSEHRAAVKQDFAELRLATKHDIDLAIRWIVGMMLALSMAGITIITFVLNYATPKAPPAVPATAQPIVIYLTAPTTAAPSPQR